MVLGESKDVLNSIVILLNEYLTKTHYNNHNVTLLSECFHNGVRLRVCLLDLFKKHYSSLLKYNSSWVFSYYISITRGVASTYEEGRPD